MHFAALRIPHSKDIYFRLSSREPDAFDSILGAAKDKCGQRHLFYVSQTSTNRPFLDIDQLKSDNLYLTRQARLRE